MVLRINSLPVSLKGHHCTVSVLLKKKNQTSCACFVCSLYSEHWWPHLLSLPPPPPPIPFFFLLLLLDFCPSHCLLSSFHFYYCLLTVSTCLALIFRFLCLSLGFFLLMRGFTQNIHSLFFFFLSPTDLEPQLPLPAVTSLYVLERSNPLRGLHQVKAKLFKS